MRHITMHCLAIFSGIVVVATLLGNDKGEAGHSTHDEAFTTYQQGFKKKNAALVSRSISERARDGILLREWSREFELRFPGPHVKQIVSKYVAEDRRQELTRREVPIKPHELSAV